MFTNFSTIMELKNRDTRIKKSLSLLGKEFRILPFELKPFW